jgi:hypothetical protein
MGNFQFKINYYLTWENIDTGFLQLKLVQAFWTENGIFLKPTDCLIFKAVF